MYNQSKIVDSAAALLTQCEHRKGGFAIGLLKSDAPKDPNKPWPKPHEIPPWTPLADVHKLVSCDLMGAIMFHGDEPEWLDVYQRCRAVLDERGVTWALSAWNDAPDTTKDDVIGLLRAVGP